MRTDPAAALVFYGSESFRILRAGLETGLEPAGTLSGSSDMKYQDNYVFITGNVINYI